jgi:predicted enzyme related to lactoylglutathione lyase
MAAIRYIVHDVDRAVAFYRDVLSFEVLMHSPAGFAALSRNDLHLYLNKPGAGGAGRAGGSPEPGGWNRFQLAVDDLDAAVRSLTEAGVSLRGTIVTGGGGKQALIEDPAGNPIELFEPAAPGR